MILYLCVGFSRSRIPISHGYPISSDVMFGARHWCVSIGHRSTEDIPMSGYESADHFPGRTTRDL